MPKRLLFAMVLYAGLVALCIGTLSDWRIRLAAVVVVMLFAGRTLWQPRTTAPVAVQGRPADVGHGGDED